MMRARIPLLRSKFGSGLTIRSYSVRIIDKPSSLVKTIADLKSWRLDSGKALDVEVHGWVRAVRKSPGVRFVDLVDGSSMRPMQAVVEKDLASE